MFRKIVLAPLVLCTGLSAQIAVVNAASFSTTQPVTAGSWAAAFGTFAGAGAGTTAPAPPFPKTLGGTRLTIEGIDAPLFDVRQSQITFLVPSAITAGIHPVVVTTPLGAVSGTVRVISAGPGLFVKDTATPPKGAVLNQSGAENTQALPAARGEIISIYGTGPGAFNTTYVDGAAPGTTPLITTKSAPQVFIGGVEAKVEFTGLNPFSPGLWQINVVVPDLAFITGRVSVQVFMDGVDSNEVAIFVR